MWEYAGIGEPEVYRALPVIDRFFTGGSRDAFRLPVLDFLANFHIFFDLARRRAKHRDLTGL
jgi:hypothetical protein